MALNKALLKSDIKSAFEAQKQNESDPEGAVNDLAQKIADAVEKYITSAQIYATPAQVTSATMVAGGSYPVVAANNLICTLQ